MTASTILLAPVRGLALRYITVDVCGNLTEYAAGPPAVAASKETVLRAFTKVEAKPQIYEGDEIKVYNADGTLDFVDKPLPYTEYDNISISMARRNPKLIPFMTGAQSIVAHTTNHIIGISEPVPGGTAAPGGTLEVWTRNGGTSGCGDDATAVFPWIVHVWQWTKNWVDKTGVVVEKAASPEVVLEGLGYPNDNFGKGPHEAYDATTHLVQLLSGHRSMLATATEPPANADGIAYVKTPA
jgi:hypothetical protein